MEQYSKLISGLSLILVCLGYLQLWYYYDQFGISINKYIGVSEVITNSIGILFEMGIKILLPFFFAYTTVEDLQEFVAKKGVKKKWLLSNFIGLLIVIVIMGTISFFLWRDVREVIYQQAAFCVWAVLSVYNEFPKNDTTFILSEKQKSSTIMSSLLLIIAAQFFLINTSMVREVTQIPSDRYTEFTFTDSTKISTRDSIGLIGKTNDFYFFLNRHTKNTFIFPASKIEQTRMVGFKSHFGKKPGDLE